MTESLEMPRFGGGLAHPPGAEGREGIAFGFSVLLLGSPSLSVPTYACRKGAGFCQRQSGKRGRRRGAIIS